MPSLFEVKNMLVGQIFDPVPTPRGTFSEKTIVVTGGNSGLGFEACKHLVRLDVNRLIIACRDTEKGQKAKSDILSSLTSSSATSIEIWQLDLSSFASVSAFAQRVNTELDRLDGVSSNAGIEVKEFALAENFESHLTVNVLSPFFLALLLLPKLQETGQKHACPAYFSVIGSGIHIFGPQDQLIHAPEGAVFQSLSQSRTADIPNRYFLSKLMVMQCVQELAKRTTAAGGKSHRVVVNCVNPGFCRTNLYSRFQPPLFTRLMLALVAWSAEKGGRTLVHGVDAGARSHGRYLSECRVKGTSAFMRSEEGLAVQEKVWKDLVGVLEGFRPGIGDGLA